MIELVDAARWTAATRHPFLDGARDGTLPADSFERWLDQDRVFVAALARAWGRMLSTAPDGALQLIADGIGAFVAELAWFDEAGATPAEPLLVTAEYVAHLERVSAAPHAVALAAMWVVEAAYLDAWRSALPGAPRYREFVEHWTTTEFAAFVERLETAADAALEAAPEHLDAVRLVLDETAHHEARFWQMTWSGVAGPIASG